MKKIITMAALAAVALSMAVTARAAVTESAVTGIQTGTGRSDIHIALGAPSEQSVNGMKERFALTDGGSAVLIYNEWGYLAHGYIVK